MLAAAYPDQFRLDYALSREQKVRYRLRYRRCSCCNGGTAVAVHSLLTQLPLSPHHTVPCTAPLFYRLPRTALYRSAVPR